MYSRLTNRKGDLMGFLKSLFGGKETAPAKPKTAGELEYKGFLIKATPTAQGREYQLVGTIEKDIDGVRREHKLVRVDRFATLEEAAQYTLAKGRQIVDEQGEAMFR
jgi:hypothetical protein